jgi:DNA-binding winged helix-turn-helix (wHTH) protein
LILTFRIGAGGTLVDVLEVQDVVVDPESRRVWRAGEEIRLSRKEFDLLHALISRPGEIVSRDLLMQEVWQTTFWTSAKTIDVHLGWLRRKLGDDPRRPTLITTIRGRGLRFEPVSPRGTTGTDIGTAGAAAAQVSSDLPEPVAAVAPEVEPAEGAPS